MVFAWWTVLPSARYYSSWLRPNLKTDLQSCWYLFCLPMRRWCGSHSGWPWLPFVFKPAPIHSLEYCNLSYVILVFNISFTYQSHHRGPVMYSRWYSCWQRILIRQWFAVVAKLKLLLTWTNIMKNTDILRLYEPKDVFPRPVPLLSSILAPAVT